MPLATHRDLAHNCLGARAAAYEPRFTVPLDKWMQCPNPDTQGQIRTRGTRRYGKLVENKRAISGHGVATTGLSWLASCVKSYTRHAVSCDAPA